MMKLRMETMLLHNEKREGNFASYDDDSLLLFLIRFVKAEYQTKLLMLTIPRLAFQRSCSWFRFMFYSF